MNYIWELTEQEIEKCKQGGCSIGELQEAKKRAYIEHGGVILNPDALEDLYEACLTALGVMATLDQDKGWVKEISDVIQVALAKARKE